MTTVIKSLAKIALAKPKAELPKLPEELWLDIFRHACGLSDFCDAPRLLSFPVALPKKLLLRRMKFQRRIILVCKAWYRIALPCLYEEIAVLDNAGLHAIADCMSKHLLGHSTKRLDFFAEEDVDEETFFALLDRLDNLKIVTIASSVSASISKRIFALPNLTVFCNTWNGSLQFPEPAFQKYVFRAMSFPFPGYNGEFPSALSELSQIYFPHSVHIVDPEEVSILCRNLQSVTSILFGYDHVQYSPLLSCIFDILPNLHYIGIQTTFQNFFKDSINAFPPSVHTFGLIFQSPKAKTRTYRRLCEILKQIQGDGLKVIRLGEETVHDLRSRPSAAALVEETFMAKGWRMEVGDQYV
ncbi:hypothetical protein GGU10DRAFT_385111 [Lentinula aff. detonsa]|uniref:F-box domain-containing protein n=1 Tax=Lentinula aff. detonsa TaxID=2804958 RepID=A0AA38KBU2_9AGAR|nr:hypothetical protein GGU10DRAFT_385111 [Lentinula aff. detonsa]